MAVAVARALQNREHSRRSRHGSAIARTILSGNPFRHPQRKKASSPRTRSTFRSTHGKRPAMLAACWRAAEPVRFNFTMLKGRANYLCTRRLHKAMQHRQPLHLSEAEE